MKRFYKDVTISSASEGFAVLLDGKPIRTPAGRAFLLPVEELGEMAAEEWRAQEETIRPETMPLTKLVNSVLDGVGQAREAVAEAVAQLGSTDLLCYRAEGPEALVARQARQWQPLLDWAAEHHGIRLTTQTGITPVDQPRGSLKALRAALAGLDPFTLGAAHVAAGLTGSAVIALALIHGRLDAEDAWAASRVDEDWQAEKWGVDEEAAARARDRWRDFAAAAEAIRILAYNR